MNGSELYSRILTFDENLRKVRRQVDPGPKRSASAAVPKLPKAYYTFVENATDDEIDRFWDAIRAKDYALAQTVSGLKPSAIVAIVAASDGIGKINGSASSADYYFGPIKLHVWLDAIRNNPDRLVRRYWQRYVNAKKGPPWEGLPKRAREAFAKMAVLYNRLASG